MGVALINKFRRARHTFDQGIAGFEDVSEVGRALGGHGRAQRIFGHNDLHAGRLTVVPLGSIPRTIGTDHPLPGSDAKAGPPENPACQAIEVNREPVGVQPNPRERRQKKHQERGRQPREVRDTSGRHGNRARAVTDLVMRPGELLARVNQAVLRLAVRALRLLRAGRCFRRHRQPAKFLGTASS